MKKSIAIPSLMLAILFLSGCSNEDALKELASLKEKASLEQDNIELVRNCLEAINNRNFAFFEEILADTYEFHSPSNNPVTIKKTEVMAFMNGALTAFPDIRYSIEDILASADKVVVRLTNTGTHQGDFQGIPATGNKIKISSTIIYRLQGNEIVEEREDADWLGLMRQLGQEVVVK